MTIYGKYMYVYNILLRGLCFLELLMSKGGPLCSDRQMLHRTNFILSHLQCSQTIFNLLHLLRYHISVTLWFKLRETSSLFHLTVDLGLLAKYYIKATVLTIGATSTAIWECKKKKLSIKSSLD